MRPSRQLPGLLALLLVLLTAAGRPPTASLAAPAFVQVVQAPAVDGVPLESVEVGSWPIYHDPSIEPVVLEHLAGGFEQALADVPRLTGLAPEGTPLRVFLLADVVRFRQALAELAGVPIHLLSEEISGYAIERDGTMLIFFIGRDVQTWQEAYAGFVHELTHLAVREASRRRPVPQWFNEGYASWIGQQATREHAPERADEQQALDRAVVASAIHSRGGLLPWGELNNRTRFTRSTKDGLGTLAYAQSTLLIDQLARQHGPERLAEFLLLIGAGQTPAQAFPPLFGQFAPKAETLGATAVVLAEQAPRGIHQVTAALRAGTPAVFAVVGGAPDEPVTVELHFEQREPRRLEWSLDAAGFTPITASAASLDEPGSKRLVVTTPSLGRLEVVLEVEPVPVARRLALQPWWSRRAA